MFSQLFYNYFFLSLIVNDLQMHFSPFFYFPLSLFYFSFPNSQFSILHSQFSKSRRIFTNSRRLSSKRRRLFFLFIPTFPNQINGNRFQSSLDLLSIPVYPGWYSSIIYLLYHKRFFFTPFTHLFICLTIRHFLWMVWRSVIILLQAHQKELLKMLFGF